MSPVPAESMAWIPSGTFLMGSNEFYPEERPVREITMSGFWIDVYPVTVGEFRRFVDDTGYVTLAERPVDPADYPAADPELLVPGSAVFRPTEGPVALNSLIWWEYVPGACWKRPEGPAEADRQEDHPVTHIAYGDAEAYARWAGKALPSEVEWERAARGTRVGARFAWGDDEKVEDEWMANTWQGEFPWQNLALDGYVGTSPVGAFPCNDFGLYDMIGNVWEWTTSEFRSQTTEIRPRCCAPPVEAGDTVGTRVIKGGSHLCAPNYCLRYRPAARQAQCVDTSTTHVGFRCVVRP